MWIVLLEATVALIVRVTCLMDFFHLQLLATVLWSLQTFCGCWSEVNRVLQRRTRACPLPAAALISFVLLLAWKSCNIQVPELFSTLVPVLSLLLVLSKWSCFWRLGVKRYKLALNLQFIAVRNSGRNLEETTWHTNHCWSWGNHPLLSYPFSVSTVEL
jgi:hypothetical protein